MPTRPWKKSDGLLSTLRSNKNNSLVVQPGFPTSLADLIVKNHQRLLKSKKKPSPAPDPCNPPSPALDCDSGEIGKLLSCNLPIAEPRGRRFWLFSGILVILVVLLIGKKKLVVWITVSASLLVVLEFCGRFLKLEQSRVGEKLKSKKKILRKFVGVGVVEEEEVLRLKTSHGDLGDGDVNKLHKCFQFILFLIVLCGLMKGKVVALGLVLVWCFLFRFIRVLREGKMI